METVVVVVHIIVVVALLGTILLQSPEPSIGVSSGAFVKARPPSNPLVRVGTVLAIVFFSTSLFLGILKGRDVSQSSVFVESEESATVPEKTSSSGDETSAPTMLEQLQELQKKTNGGGEAGKSSAPTMLEQLQELQQKTSDGGEAGKSSAPTRTEPSQQLKEDAGKVKKAEKPDGSNSSKATPHDTK